MKFYIILLMIISGGNAKALEYEFGFDNDGIKFKYAIKSSSLIPGYTLNQIKSGLTLGYYPCSSECSTSAPNNLPPANSVFDLISSTTSQSKKVIQSLKGEVKKVLAESSKEPGEEVDGDDQETEFPKVFPYDLGKFISCADRSLPLLKRLYHFELSGTQDGIDSMDLLLANDRGNGNEVVSSGVVCGKYLGKKGFFKPNLVEEIKFLEAIKGRSDQEVEQILKVAFITYDLSTPLEIKNTWSEVLKRTLIYAYFKKDEPLPSISEIENNLKSERMKYFSERVLAGDTSRPHAIQVTSRAKDISLDIKKGLSHVIQ